MSLIYPLSLLHGDQAELLTDFILGYDTEPHVDLGQHLDMLSQPLLETMKTRCIVTCHGMF